MNMKNENWFVRNTSGYKVVLRVMFGLVWLADAWLKWQPAFFSGFESMIQSSMAQQPSWMMPWFQFWINMTSPDPYLFALLIAVVETLFAFAILFGFLRKVTYFLGVIFSFFIWSVPEGFGGFYIYGATDIGTSIIYVLVFLFLILVNGVFGPSRYSLDYYIERKFSGWNRLAEISPNTK
ncbi:MAG: DoxX family protein [Candidatus Thermoplasmatota archaeon]|nr:DoxX family protein [Candidatus Thermoplasmatota archaeon]MDA8142982.1 DoxX family protein [Thermoplasmatales archaeon]